MKLKLGKPEKFSFLYFFLHSTYFKILFFEWFKRIAWKNKHYIYKNYPIILAINHQNTLMDPLVVLGIEYRQIVWLARADIFKNSIAAAFLRKIKIMPAFRQHDGIEQLGNNKIVFEKCVTVLSKNKVIALFPEGTHWGYRRLRKTKKAIPRIAFMAEEQYDFTLNTHVIPVGINYSNYSRLRSNVFVNFGEPIPVSQYKELYEKNEQEAHNALRDTIEQGMKDTMIHIPFSDENYEIINELRHILENKAAQIHEIKNRKLLVKQFYAHKKIVEQLTTCVTESPEQYESIKSTTKEYMQVLRNYNIRDWLVEKRGNTTLNILFNLLVLIVLSPVFVVGFVFHAPFYYTFNAVVKKIAKDPLFHSSLNFAFTFLVGPILYIVYSLLFLKITSLSVGYMFLFLVILLYSAVLSFEYSLLAKKFYYTIRYNFMKMTNAPKIKTIEQLRKKILRQYVTITANNNTKI